MEFWLSITVAVLLAVIFFMAVRLLLIHRSTMEIPEAPDDSFSSATNVLISISSRDQSMRELANKLNTELKKLNSDPRRYQKGDWELKDTKRSLPHLREYHQQCPEIQRRVSKQPSRSCLPISIQTYYVYQARP